MIKRIRSIFLKNPKLTKVGWGFLVLAVLGIGAFALPKILTIDAKFTQNDKQAVIEFSDASGLSDRSDNVEIAQYQATVPAGEAGDMTTVDIRPASFSEWGLITVDSERGSGSVIRLQIFDCDGDIVPDSAVPGNSSGRTLNSSGSFTIPSTMAADSYPCIRVKLSLQSSSTLPIAVKQIKVTWQSKTVYTVNTTAQGGTKSGDVTNYPAGQSVSFRVDYSVSYSQGTGVVAYLPIPSLISTLNTDYGQTAQDVAMSFSSAGQGGQFTNAAIQVNGVNVPANSVYWDIGDKSAGSTGALVATFATKNGSQNGVTYRTRASLVSSEASVENIRDSEYRNIRLTSSPKLNITKSASNVISIARGTYAYEGAPYDGKVVYNVTARNYDSISSSTNTETIFNPVITDNLTAIDNFFSAYCPS
ncbi:MAG: hypothetical protein LBL08_03420, partial [Candidatus Nomurabacteria bacterium]|nr:hypothetical protein [Candidatus Nomurabacteria bacterium]